MHTIALGDVMELERIVAVIIELLEEQKGVGIRYVFGKAPKEKGADTDREKSQDTNGKRKDF